MDSDERLEQLERSHRRLKYVLAAVGVVALALAGLAAVQQRNGKSAGTVRAQKVVLVGDDGKAEATLDDDNLVFRGPDDQLHARYGAASTMLNDYEEDGGLRLSPWKVKFATGGLYPAAAFQLGNSGPELRLNGEEGQTRVWLRRHGLQFWDDDETPRLRLEKDKIIMYSGGGRRIVEVP